MPLKNKLVAFIVSIVMCASFVPALALADVVDGEQQPDVVNEEQEHGIADEAGMAAQADDEEAAEMTAQATEVQLDFKGATGVSGNVLSYEGGYKVEVSTGDTGSWRETNLTVSPGAKVTFKFMPPEGYGGNASLVFDGKAIPFKDGMLTYTVASSDKPIVVDLNAEAGPQGTRKVKLTIDEASLPMLADKCTLKVGYGDDDDVKFGVGDNGKEIEVSAKTLERTLLAFTIDTRYFIPTAVVNGKTFETFDEGTTPDDPSRVNIVVELDGEDAAADEFNVNLSIGAQANVNLQAQSVSRANARYMLVEDGKALVENVAATEIDLAISDTDTDTSVAGAVATFDLGAQVNGAAAAETETPLDVVMVLDTNVYTGSNYVVDREHNGVHTELATTYDATTGALGFSSDLYSKYTLVDKDAATKATTKTTVAKTGDPLTAAGMLAIALAAFGIAVFATRRLSSKA